MNNEWHKSKSNKTFKVENPTTGEIITEVQQANKEDIDCAVKYAKKAFEFNSEWRRTDASHRGVLLNRLADLIEKNAVYLAVSSLFLHFLTKIVKFKKNQLTF